MTLVTSTTTQSSVSVCYDLVCRCYNECSLWPGFSPISRVREKSLSLLGVIAGLVLLMLFLALLTCIRQRQMYKVTAADIST